MKAIYTSLAFLLVINWISAQEVVSSAGETHTSTGYILSWTLGEPVIETVINASNTLTQGFHQSELTITTDTELEYPDFFVKVFPNPSHDFVAIQLEEVKKDLLFSLFDHSGRLLKTGRIVSSYTELDLRQFSIGVYILKLTWESDKHMQTFTIIKE